MSTIQNSCFFNFSSTGYPITDLFRYDQTSCSKEGCPRGQYSCYSNLYCIDIELLCDGISHCYHGDDEMNCGCSILLYFQLRIKLNLYFTDSFHLYGYFKCQYEKRYLINHRVCNGIVDCLYGSDEMFCKLSDIRVNKCKQFNYIMLECAENYPNISENHNDYFKENDESIRYLVIKGNVNMRFLNNSVFVTVLKINGNVKFLNQLQLVYFPNIFHVEVKNSSFNGKLLMIDQNFKNLCLLDVSFNPFDSLEFLNKLKSPNLQYLDISSTKINKLHEFDLEGFQFLETLRVINCNLLKIDTNFVQNFNFLKNLFMNDTIIKEEIDFINFKNLRKISYIKTEYFKICCLIFSFLHYPDNLQCFPRYSLFRTCSNLIDFKFKQILFFSIGTMGFMGNLFFVTIFLFKFNLKNCYQCLLHISDLLISSYILAIALADVHFKNDYIVNDTKWRKSTLCQILGTITTFSITLATTSTLFITIERFLVVVNPMKMNVMHKLKKQFSCCLILFCTFLSFLPFTFKIVNI